nr:MAG TPA: hypothetical protein [Caudoviricetes sp.]
MHRVRYLKPYGELTRIYSFNYHRQSYGIFGIAIGMWLAANAPLTNKKAK